MTDTFDPAGWVHKLHIEVIDEEDGSGTIAIEWDETDTDLDYWNSLGKEGQEKFIMDALHVSIENLDLLPMTLDTYGLPEEKYLAIFEEKAEFACKALLTLYNV
jgi:hypothetical protein